MRQQAGLHAILLLLVLSGLLAPASAQISIDDFFVPTSLLQATAGNPVDEDSNLTIDSFNASRRISAQAAGGFGLDTEVDGTAWIIDGGGMGPGSASASAEYLGFSLDLGTNYFLEFAVNRVAGTPVLGVILQNASQGMTLTGGAVLWLARRGWRRSGAAA